MKQERGEQVGNLSLTEKDQGLLRLLSSKQAGSVLHRLLGKDCALDERAQEVYQSIFRDTEKRAADAKRKRKIQGNSAEIPRIFHGDSAECHKTAPPFFPPSSFSPTPPFSSPPYYPPTAPVAAGAVDVNFGAVMTLYLDRVNDRPSPYCVSMLKAYVENLGAAVVSRAISYAIDEGDSKNKWAYIVKILRRCTKDKVTSLALWEEQEEKRERSKAHGTGANTAAKRAAESADDAWGIRGTITAGD